MSKTVAEYLKKPYQRVIIPQENGRFYSKITEFPGCFAEGLNEQEALANLAEVAIIWLEEEIRKGNPIPKPEQDQEYSGKFMLRISPVLHRECAQNAARQGISLNQYIMQKLSSSARQDSIIYILKEELRAIKPIHIEHAEFIQSSESTPSRHEELRGLRSLQVATTASVGWGK